MHTLKKKSDSDLHKELNEKRSELQRFRFGMTGSKIRNVKHGRDLRKDIARVMTELGHRSSEGSKE